MSGAVAALRAPAVAVTFGQELGWATAALGAAGVEGPRRDARLLLAGAVGLGVETVLAHPERPLDAAAATLFRRHVERRRRREPIARILARREFWGLGFALDPATLVPRPDSETLIEAALDLLEERSRPYAILDLGTGSGCLLLALLSELPGATGVGVDRDPSAVRCAAANAAVLGLASRARFLAGDWGRGLAGRFNLILTNPPYLRSDEIERLAPEVALWEPRAALDGGSDGLAAYRALAPDLGRLLQDDGRALLEIGPGQAGEVEEILLAHGLAIEGYRRDLGGAIRCLVAIRARRDVGGEGKKTVGNPCDPV